eukprot:gene20145-33994_t
MSSFRGTLLDPDRTSSSQSPTRPQQPAADGGQHRQQSGRFLAEAVAAARAAWAPQASSRTSVNPFGRSSSSSSAAVTRTNANANAGAAVEVDIDDPFGLARKAEAAVPPLYATRSNSKGGGGLGKAGLQLLKEKKDSGAISTDEYEHLVAIQRLSIAATSASSSSSSTATISGTKSSNTSAFGIGNAGPAFSSFTGLERKMQELSEADRITSATPGDAVHAAMGRAAALAPLPAGMDSVQEAILSVTLDTFERPISGGGQAGGTAATAMMLQLPPPPPVPMPPWLDFRMVRAEIEANKAALDCATSTAVDVAMAAAAQPRRDAEAARDAAVTRLK